MQEGYPDIMPKARSLKSPLVAWAKLPTRLVSRCFIFTLIVGVGLLLTNYAGVFKLHSQRQLVPAAASSTGSRPDVHRHFAETEGQGLNILCVFTGRWPYLRINFPYIYRSLRENGGVLDKVYYVMIQYDRDTWSNLSELVDTANHLLGREVFEFRFLNHGADKTERPANIFSEFYPMIFQEMVAHPYRKYIKMDDDIVYVHPGAFRNLMERENTSECFIHFANIGGANWRSSYIHQEMGLFKDRAINPKKLKFQFHKSAKCGYKSAQCAEVALRGFFHHYERQTLDKFLFEGRYIMVERARYSINMFLIDLNLFELKTLLESGPIRPDDEMWWTENYAPRASKPSCVVGSAFVVHFSYFINCKQILKAGYLKRFEAIVHKDLAVSLPKAFQKILRFDQEEA